MADEKKPVLAPIKIVRDTWVQKDGAPEGETERISAGTIVELPAKAARELINAGIGERADPLPGE